MHKLSIALLMFPALGWAGDLALPAALNAMSATLMQDGASPSSTTNAERAAQDPEGAPSPEIANWIRALGSAEEAERESARQALKNAGAKARAALELAARESSDPEVRWNARKLLRQIEEEASTPAPKSRLEPLRGHAESKDAQPKFRELDGEAPFPQDLREGANRGVTKSVQIGPDGRVQVTVTENIDGERVTKNYEANSMEELRAKHPGVLRDVGIGIAPMPQLPGMEMPGLENIEELFQRLNLRMEGFDAPQDGGLPEMKEFWRELRRGPQERAPQEESIPGFEVAPRVELAPSERLGVKVEALHPEVAQFLDVPEGTGLIVAEVLEGTLAQSLGLQAKDVLVRIQDQVVRTPDSIRTALAKTPLDEKIRVEVLRFSSGKVTVEAKRPDAARESADGLPAHGDGPKPLERRDTRK